MKKKYKMSNKQPGMMKIILNSFKSAVKFEVNLSNEQPNQMKKN